MKAGDPGYLERVDCEEEIGIFIDPVTNERNPTTWVIIVHGKDGVYMVPARPPSKEKISEDELKQRVLAEMKRALPTSLPSLFHGVSIEWNRTEISLLCYYHGVISDSDREVMDDIAGEVIAGFTDHTIKIHYVQEDMPESQKRFNFNTFRNER